MKTRSLVLQVPVCPARSCFILLHFRVLMLVLMLEKTGSSKGYIQEICHADQAWRAAVGQW